MKAGVKEKKKIKYMNNSDTTNKVLRNQLNIIMNLPKIHLKAKIKDKDNYANTATLR